MSELEKKIKKIRDKHSKGLCISENALVELEQIFKGLNGFEHCHTSPEGDMEVVINNEYSDGDYSISQALELLEMQKEEDRK